MVKVISIYRINATEGVQLNVPDFKLEKLNNSGLEWNTSILVDVILEIESKSTKNKFYLISKDQNIVRTE